MGTHALSRQQITSVPIALEWLHQAAGFGFEEALEYLQRLKSSVQVLKVYQKVFPGQYSISQAPMFEQDREWPEYTAREGEFLRLLNQRDMLPIYLADEWEWLNERCGGIPAPPMQNYQWCCGDFDEEELPDAYYLGMAALTGHWENAINRYQLDKSEMMFNQEVDYTLFDERLSKESDALKFLHVTTDMMQYSTGNSFLDSSYCNNPDYYEWSVENLRRLVREYKQAKLIMKGVWRLDDLIEADPVSVYRRVRAIWNQSPKEKNDDSSSKS